MPRYLRAEKKKRKRKIYLTILLLITFVFSIIILPPRFVEDKKKETGFYIDYDTLINLSFYWGLTPEQTLSKLKKKGFVGLALSEEIGSSEEVFNNKARLFSNVNAILTFPELRNAIELEAPHTYLITRNPDIVESVVESLKTRRIKSQLDEVNDKYILKINHLYESKDKLLLGYDPEGIKTAKKNDLDILFFVHGWSISNKQDVTSFLSYLKDFVPQPKIAFLDKNMADDEEFIKLFSNSLLNGGFSVGLLDGTYQPEVNSIISLNKLPTFRVRHITIDDNKSSEILANLEARIQDIKIGIIERRNEAIVFKIPAKDFNKTTVDAFEILTSRVYETMKGHGYNFLPISPIKKISEAKNEKLLLSILLILLAGYTMISFNLINPITALAFTTILLISGLTLFYFASDFYFKLCAFLAAVLYPLISLFFLNIENSRSLLNGLISLVLLSLICIFGGFVISAFLTGNDYFVHADLYRGVKVSFVLPVLIFAIYAAKVLLMKDKDLQSLVFRYLNVELKVWQLIALLFILVAGVYYILRTGNVDRSMVLPGEIELRVLLNKYMYVRPRFKEFAIGYPILLWGLWTKASQEKRYIAFVIGSLAPVTIINSFAHQYTPITVSLLRTVNALFLGVILGTMLIIINKFLVNAFTTNNREKKGNLNERILKFR